MITALVGGQFGSEGKGLIAGHIALGHKHHVRVGAANAGHTAYTDGNDDWEKHVLQQIPCGAYTNPRADLYIGPGGMISPDVFLEELHQLAIWRKHAGYEEPVVYVDPRAHVVRDDHIKEELESGLALRIGSTSATAREGIGAAQAARVMRREDCVPAERFFGAFDVPFIRIANVPFLLGILTKNATNRILLEGTQGYGLSLTTGDFPYVTSRNTTAAGLLADCGLPPKRLDRVIAVFRTYPIRVAGNSGPFAPGSHEMAWSDIGIDPENERTTVTKKIRRVATFSFTQAWEACKVNGATEVALTFADYLDPGISGLAGIWERRGDTIQRHPRVLQMVDQLEFEADAPVKMIGTGPHSVIDLA